MAEPNYNRPITPAQVRLADEQRRAIIRRAENQAAKNGDKNVILQGKNVINQQDYVNRFGTDYVNNWGNDIWGTAKANLADTFSFIPSWYNKLVGAKGADQLSQQEAINKFIPWASRNTKSKYALDKYVIPGQFRTAKGGFTAGSGKQIKKRYQAYKQDAVKHGKEPVSLSQFLAFNTPDREKARIEAGTNTDILPIMIGRYGVKQARQQLVEAIKNAPDQDTRKQLHQKLVQLGALNERVENQYKNLRPIDKFRYYFTPMGATALGAYLAPAALLQMAGFEGVRRYAASPIAKKITNAISQDKVALGNAILNGNYYLLSPQLKARLQKFQEQEGLPDINSKNPEDRQLWSVYGKRLLDSAATTDKIGQGVADFIPMAFNPLRALTAGARTSGRVLSRTGIKSGIKSIPKAVVHNVKSTVTKPSVFDVGQTVATIPAIPTEPVSAEHQVISGQAPIQDYKKILRQAGVPDTAQNVMALHRASKADAEIAQSAFNGKAGDVAVKVGSPLIGKTFQNTVKERLQLANLTGKDFQQKLPQHIRKRQAAEMDPDQQILFQKWRQNPQSRQFVKKQFAGLTPKQYRQLFALQDVVSKKQGAYIPTKTAKANSDWTLQVARQAATQNYKRDLSQQDPDKFFSKMQEWMPLVYQIGGTQVDSPLKQATQKAVWAHVKRNPLFINKAMSIWAMSNGFDSLASFLGSNGAFYGTLVGLPLTIALMSSLFGGSKAAPQQAPQQVPQRYQPMVYAPRGITERGLIVG